MTMTHTHPRWCDPRLCEHTISNLDHRAAPTTWTPTAADVELSTGLVRLDEVGHFEVTGTTHVMLTVDNNVINDGGPVVEVDLSPADARMLAAALVVAAEQAETEQHRRAA